MSEDSYRVVFEGTISNEFDLDTTKKRFARSFKLSEKNTERLFSGKEHILKTGVSEAEAMKFAVGLANIGCECFIELIPLDDDISNQPGFVERRNVRDRRIAASRRKVVRGSSIRPDRRQNDGRRRLDK